MSLQGSEMLEGSRFLDQEEFHAKRVVSLSILMLYLPLHVYYFFSCVNLDPCDCNIVYHLRYINQSATQPGRARRLHGGEAWEGGREDERPGAWQKGGWEEIRRLAGSPLRLAAATWRTAALEWSRS